MKHTILYTMTHAFIAELWLDEQRKALQARKGDVVPWLESQR